MTPTYDDLLDEVTVLRQRLAGRLLIQGSSGAGKSRTLRRIIEEAFDYTTLAIVDPEGEFENLARHIGATTIRAVELTADGLTAAATRSRRHRLSMHIDLTDLDHLALVASDVMPHLDSDTLGG